MISGGMLKMRMMLWSLLIVVFIWLSVMSFIHSNCVVVLFIELIICVYFSDCLTVERVPRGQYNLRSLCQWFVVNSVMLLVFVFQMASAGGEGSVDSKAELSSLLEQWEREQQSGTNELLNILTKSDFTTHAKHEYRLMMFHPIMKILISFSKPVYMCLFG